MYNTKKIIKNAFRISKVRGESVIRIRVPGGHLDVKHLTMIKDLANEFGNGTVHLSSRQGFEIPGVKFADMDKIKERMAKMIYDIEENSDVILDSPKQGYPSAGTRNIAACIGNRACRFSNADTTLLAQKIEKAIYPNNYHLKVTIVGCPNDCIKAHMNDVGIISNIIPEYDSQKCIGCEACLDNCRKIVTNALYSENCEIVRDEDYCIKCGECILKCPTGAFYRGDQLYRILIGGRAGKRQPRLGNTFIENASEDVIIEVLKRIYSFIHRYVDKALAFERFNTIIDRIGYEAFARGVTENLKLNPQAKIVEIINHGYTYKRRPE